MNQTTTAAIMSLVLALSACSVTAETITSSASGEIIRDMTARASGGGSPFDGQVNEKSDLDDLVATAWGNGAFGLHRGHSSVLGVLKAFWGISHKQMHVLMEQEAMNLARVCQHLGFKPENLIETLTASFVPYLEQGVTNGVITRDELPAWTQQIRSAFTKRVYWDG